MNLLMMDLTEKIENLIEPFLKEEAFVLVDLNVHQTRGQVAIRILTDHPYGGITIGECTRLNRKICEALENQNLITDRYTLEVSSPGLDRPLKTYLDLRRVINREVRFFLSSPRAGKLEYTGVVKDVNEQETIVECAGLEVAIPISDINKAKQIVNTGRI